MRDHRREFKELLDTAPLSVFRQDGTSRSKSAAVVEDCRAMADTLVTRAEEIRERKVATAVHLAVLLTRMGA